MKKSHALDAVAVAVAGAAWVKLLPPIAAGLSIVWLLIQIGEWLYKKIKQ